jgi:hypothetical protein
MTLGMVEVKKGFEVFCSSHGIGIDSASIGKLEQTV